MTGGQIDLQTFLDLEPEELGARILLELKRSVLPHEPGGVVHGLVHPFNNYKALMTAFLGPEAGPVGRREDVSLAYSSAWAWLEAQGLLVPAASQSIGSGFRQLSRRAHRFSKLADFLPYQIARRLDREMLHPRIREEVWAAFIRGHFNVAAGVALQAVEVAVREVAAQEGRDDAARFATLYGKPLMAAAFNPERGPLSDPEALMSEREAVRDLFQGAIGAHRNPLAHGRVTLENAVEVVEVVMLANHLLRVVDRAAARKSSR